MSTCKIVFEPTFESWRARARTAIIQRLIPSETLWEPAWNHSQQSLGLDTLQELGPPPANAATLRLPQKFIESAKRVACHSDTAKWDLLYRLAWRLVYEDNVLMHNAVDEDVHKFWRMEKAVRYECHKMKAFVRFRLVREEHRPLYVAWFEPQHPVLGLVAPFFARRFADMHWMVRTPDSTAHWDGVQLHLSHNESNSSIKLRDSLEDLWKDYYRSIYNPARLKQKAMQGHMPKRFWKFMPETEEIEDLIREQPEVLPKLQRTRAPAAQPYLPEERTQSALRAALSGCRGCDLYRNATQAVFGEGPAHARLFLIGEQPGDEEDKQGKPFIGPAGRLLDSALEAAGIGRDQIYITNAVKHFKWKPVGKRRLHQKPRAGEIAACSAWLYEELRNIQPEVVVCLGATAAQSILGKITKLSDFKGRTVESRFSKHTIVTVHPSYILRLADESKEQARDTLVQDLKRAKALLGRLPA